MQKLTEKKQMKKQPSKKEVKESENRMDSPIGLFDSGIGGLSVYQHLAKILPNENYLYFADTLNVPYGGREHTQIVELSLNAVEWLYQRGCKLIVIACNSASAHALEIARAKYPNIPIVGLVPALKPAVQASKTKHVAVLATQATLNGRLLNDVINHIAVPNQTKVTKYFDSTLVPWVEAGMPHDSLTADKLRHTIQNFYQEGVDQIVLGCTHYPFFRPFMQNYIDSNDWKMQITDSGQAIAMRVKQLLYVEDNLKKSDNLKPLDSATLVPIRLYNSKQDEKIVQVLQHLSPSTIELVN